MACVIKPSSDVHFFGAACSGIFFALIVLLWRTEMLLSLFPEKLKENV
jgi:hypothetical protein